MKNIEKVTADPETSDGNVEERGPTWVGIPPLAAFIADEMELRGWLASDVVAHMMGLSEQEIQRDVLALYLLFFVHKDNLLVGDDLFAKLARAFGVSEQFFRNLDHRWRSAAPENREPFEFPEHLADIPINGPPLPTSGSIMQGDATGTDVGGQ